MPAIDDAIRVLEQWGLMDIIVPFMLVFTIVYAILFKIQILGKGDENKRYSAIVALAIALAAIIPHSTRMYPAETDPVVLINNSLPSIAAIVIALIMALILIGSFGYGFVGGAIFQSLFAITAFVVVLYIFGTNAGWFQYGFTQTFSWYIPLEVQSLLVIVLVFGLIVYYITGGEAKVDAWGKIKKGLEEFKVEKK